MKNGRWQAKDIPDELVIRLALTMQTYDGRDKCVPVRHVLCEFFPWKVVARKLDSMERRGLIHHDDRHGFGELYGLIRVRCEKPEWGPMFPVPGVPCDGD